VLEAAMIVKIARTILQSVASSDCSELKLVASHPQALKLEILSEYLNESSLERSNDVSFPIYNDTSSKT
jgi:hypothetical protein